MPSAVALLLLAATALAAPARLADRQTGGPCLTYHDFTVTGEDVADDPPQLVTGFSCTSLPTAGCSLTKSATFTKTVTKTAGGGLSGTLQLSKILSVGADAGFSYSWSTSDATGTSATVECPEGGFECGLQAVTTMVHTKGQVHEYTSGGTCLKATSKFEDYEVVAPQTVPNVPKNQAVKMDFKACLVSCDGDACDAAKKAGLDKCPGS